MGTAKIMGKDLDDLAKIMGKDIISLGDAAVGDVKDPKTFYAGSTVLKTGTMPTVAIAAANDDYPAGYHAGDVGGLDAIDADLASANIKSGVTIFGKAGTLAIIHDTMGTDISSQTTKASANIDYEISSQIAPGGDTTILSVTITLAQASVVEGCFYGDFRCVSSADNRGKLRFFIDGVQQSESATIQLNDFGSKYSSANKACSSGDRILRVDVHSYDSANQYCHYSAMVFGGATKL